jgi:hypothetical protein
MNVIQIDRPIETNKAKPLAPPKHLHNHHPKNPQGAPHSKIRCCYINSTAQFQIIRIAVTDIAIGKTHGLVERTVLPYSSVLFEAHSHDYLEVHTGQFMSAIHSDTIPCCRLVHPSEPFS